MTDLIPPRPRYSTGMRLAVFAVFALPIMLVVGALVLVS